MGLDGDVVSKRGNRSGDPRKITKELLEPDGFLELIADDFHGLSMPM